ncbi:MAG TPA: T9SS type A sorting domain-containing protein, partial [Rhodothermales bacterium]|nr:T9SS type A sorting domain-containing protein [Rhodothermales bacterium]
TDAELGTYQTTILPWNDLRNTDLSLSFDAPLTDGVFFGETQYDGETWYQLALLPAEAIDVAAKRKVALLLDYDAGKTSVSERELVETARSLLSTHLAPTDSFTVILSRLSIHRASEDWLPADSATIAATFDALGSNPVADYSNLPTLLADGIRFIKEQASGGSLLLVSSSDQIGETTVANELINDLRAESNSLPPLHLVDLANRNVAHYNIAGRSYYGNEYFYTNLARLSGGSFFSISDGTPYPQQLSASISALRGGIGSFDLYTTRENGFCYGRFPLGSATESVFLDRAILQVGKCFGSGAFTIETSGIYQSAPFSERLSITQGAPTDSTLASMWTGRQIDQLERGPQNNDVISQIINYSLNQRVLSQYTAFIALEPSQGGEVCDSCEGEPGDDGETTDTEDEQPASGKTTLTAFPNPFNTQVTVKAKLADPMNASEITVQIYNVMGQLVRTLRISESGFVEELTLTWNGESDTGQLVASGTYFLVLTTPSGRHTLTLTLIR